MVKPILRNLLTETFYTLFSVPSNSLDNLCFLGSSFFTVLNIGLSQFLTNLLSSAIEPTSHCLFFCTENNSRQCIENSQKNGFIIFFVTNIAPCYIF